jgi:hypothetical protein
MANLNSVNERLFRGCRRNPDIGRLRRRDERRIRLRNQIASENLSKKKNASDSLHGN